MQWSDVTAPPTTRTLRQFAALWQVFFGLLAAWRGAQGIVDTRTVTLGAVAIVIGGIGLVWPTRMRWIYTTWMALAFPIGWVVSKIMVAALFFLVFTPVALLFRLMGRDALRLRRREVTSYWTVKAQPKDAMEYFRQS